MGPISPEIEAWLRGFSEAVRDRDFSRGEAMFAADAIAFGTVACRADSRSELRDRQWQRVWSQTRGFDFDYATARAHVEGSLALVLGRWSSTGFDESGASFTRRGRSTIALQRRGEEWIAIHSHFSFEPR